MRILVIEDEVALASQIEQQLERQGYAVDVAHSGEEGRFFALEYPLDAAVVDIGLPDISGLEVIKAVREQGISLPILILTARGRWQDKVEGLEIGADDYLVKPFQMEELLARIKALVRRAGGAANNLVRCGPIVLDLKAQRVTLNDNPVELTSFEYRMLEYLMRHRGEVVAKSELTDYLYPHDEDRDSNVIEVMVGRLRRKLDPQGHLKPIETLRGRGYRFALPVENDE